MAEERARKLRILQERHALVVANRTSRDKARLEQKKFKHATARDSFDSGRATDDDFDPLLQVFFAFFIPFFFK